MKSVLIIGATSAIAKEAAKLYAQNGASLRLLARDEESLDLQSKDLKARGARTVSTERLDVNDLDSHEDIVERAFSEGAIDVILIAHGTLPDQTACEQNAAEALQEIQTNCTATLSLLTHIANRMEQQNRGTIAAISSVAGDRGRKSNYVYGAAKAAVSTFLAGLRGRLHSSNVQVLDIKPGFVDTPMTRSFDKGPLWASPQKVAADIVKAIDKGRATIYTPWFWRWIMLIIRSIPEFIFKRLSL